MLSHPLHYHDLRLLLCTPRIRHLNLRASSKSRPAIPVSNPINGHAHRTNQPKQRIRQINPHSILHSLNTSIPFRLGVDVHAAKETEERDPENEENGVPDEGHGNARSEGDHVKESCDGGQGGGDFCEDLEDGCQSRCACRKLMVSR